MTMEPTRSAEPLDGARSIGERHAVLALEPIARARERATAQWRNARAVEPWLVALSISAISGFVLRVVVNPQAFLNFFYLPVAWAAWRLGLRAGGLAALYTAALMGAAAFVDGRLFAHPGERFFMRWVDLVVWAGFLYLTAYFVATLAARDKRRIEELRTAYRGVLEIMAKFIDSIDRSTEDHSRRVAEHAVELARELGLDEDEVETVRVGAYLHDIGKVEISADVLRKAAQLTPQEHREMQRHVDFGIEMLERVGGLLTHVVPIVLYHHERWDGRGYKGLAGNVIPIGARIIAVCDTYDAIVADRPYREGRPHDEALAILREQRDRQFDPAVVDAFLGLYEAAEAGADACAAA
jgi:putative nucleotidyltransferase with HDIG domain